ETLRSVGGRLPLLDHHLGRLRHTTDTLGIQFPTLQTIHKEAQLLMTLWDGPDANVRLTLTGGGRRIFRAKVAPPVSPRLSCVSRPWQPITGLEAVKHGSRAGWVIDVRRSGADEVLWVDGQGHVLEASNGGVFAIVGGHVWTPPLDGRILPSITRSVLLPLFEDLGKKVIEGRFSLSQVEAIFVASSLKVFAPVVSLDGAPLPSAEWPLLKMLIDAYFQRVCSSQGTGPPAR
ncbi:MAG: aminotransferase class IV, partial [Myxococcota bacterium]